MCYWYVGSVYQTVILSPFSFPLFYSWKRSGLSLCPVSLGRWFWSIEAQALGTWVGGGDREQASSFPVLLMFPCFFFGFVLDGPFCVIVPIQSVIFCCWLRQQGHRRFKRFLGVFCTGRSAALHGCLAALQGPLSCSFGSCVGVKARGEEFPLSL